MLTKRLLAGVLSAGLLSVTPLAVSAPANAATENHTVTITTAPSASVVKYGDNLYVSVNAAASDGRLYPNGTTTLYAQPAGSATWAPVASVSAGQSFYDVKPRKNATYKVLYSGHVATSAYENNYAPSESAPFTVAVQRNVTISKAKKRLTIKGKVKPKYKRKKVVIHRKKGKRWVKHRTVKTNKKSVFKVTLPRAKRGKKLYFRITVPGNKSFVKYSEVWYTYSYRPTTQRMNVVR